jgi:hypothetical protein
MAEQNPALRDQQLLACYANNCTGERRNDDTAMPYTGGLVTVPSTS